MLIKFLVENFAVMGEIVLWGLVITLVYWIVLTVSFIVNYIKDLIRTRNAESSLADHIRKKLNEKKEVGEEECLMMIQTFFGNEDETKKSAENWINKEEIDIVEINAGYENGKLFLIYHYYLEENN